MRDDIAWIKTIAENEAAGQLAETYEKSADPQIGDVDHHDMIHSLNPQFLNPDA